MIFFKRGRIFEGVDCEHADVLVLLAKEKRALRYMLVRLVDKKRNYGITINVGKYHC